MKQSKWRLLGVVLALSAVCLSCPRNRQDDPPERSGPDAVESTPGSDVVSQAPGPASAARAVFEDWVAACKIGDTASARDHLAPGIDENAFWETTCESWLSYFADCDDIVFKEWEVTRALDRTVYIRLVQEFRRLHNIRGAEFEVTLEEHNGSWTIVRIHRVRDF